MLARLTSRRPSPALIISLLALFISLSGIAYAASLPKNSVGTKQLKKNAVTSAKIKAGAVANSDIKNDAVDGAKIADGAVARADLGADVTSTLDAPKVVSYAAANSSSTAITGETNKTVVSRSLPAGAYSVSANVQALGASSVSNEWFNIGCRLINVPTSGASTIDSSNFLGATNSFAFIIPAGEQTMSFNMVINQTVDSTISIQCSDVAEGATSYTASATDAQINAIRVDSVN